MGEGRMTQEEAALIARGRKVHEECLHNVMFSTPYGIDALANRMAKNGKIAWSNELRERAQRARVCLDTYLTRNDERVFLGLAIHKDKAIEVLHKAKKDEGARKDLANLLVDLPLRLTDLAQAHPRNVLSFTDLLPPVSQSSGYDHQFRVFHFRYVGFFSEGVSRMGPMRRQINDEALRLQEAHLWMVEKFADKFPLEERREAISDAGRGLALSSHKYDPDMGSIDFVTYTRWCIRDAYQERTGSRSLQSSDRPFKVPTQIASDDPVLAPDYLVSLRKRGIISYKQFEVLKLRFGLAGEGEHSREEVAKIYKTIPSNIGIVEAQAFDALRKSVLVDFPDEARQYRNVIRDTA